MRLIHLSGRLTRDPEIKNMTDGTMLCKFSIAVNNGKKDKEGKRLADFYNITTWRGLAETCSKCLAKGKRVNVIGNLNLNHYESEGKKGVSVDVNADMVEFLSPIEKTEQTEDVTDAALPDEIADTDPFPDLN